jgi:hypothetical protein
MRGRILVVLVFSLAGMGIFGTLAVQSSEVRSVPSDLADSIRGAGCWITVNCDPGTSCVDRCKDDPFHTCTVDTTRKYLMPPSSGGFASLLTVCSTEMCEYLVIDAEKACQGP